MSKVRCDCSDDTSALSAEDRADCSDCGGTGWVDPPLTNVHFRLIAVCERQLVIALMPDEFYSDRRGDKTIAYYMHIGQHGGASSDTIADLTPATPEQYAALKLELESEPYNYRFKVLP